MVRQYGAASEYMTHEEYNRAVAGNRCPHGIAQVVYASPRADEDIIKHKPEFIEVEVINGIVWKFVFWLKEVQYTYRCKVDNKKRITEGLELIEVDTENGVKYRTTFKLLSTERRETSVFPASVLPEKPRVNPFTTQAFPTVESKLQSALGNIKFITGIKNTPSYWACSCWTGEPWCIHYDDYMKIGLDGDDINRKMNSSSIASGEYLYQMYGGAVSIRLDLQGHDKRDLGYDEDGIQYRWSFKDELSMWWDEGTYGMSLLRQVDDMVEASTDYTVWTSRAQPGHSPEFMCRNKFHKKSDSNNFLVAARVAREDNPQQLDNLIRANAFSDKFNGRCLSCLNFVEHMTDDAMQDLSKFNAGGLVSRPHSPAPKKKGVGASLAAQVSQYMNDVNEPF